MPGPPSPTESTSSSSQESEPVASWVEWGNITSRICLALFAIKLNRPQIPSNFGRKRPALWDICSGCILFLPEKKHVLAYAGPALRKVCSERFNHPVVVLDVKITSPEDAMVTFAFMTSSKPAKSTEIVRFWERRRVECLYLQRDHDFHAHSLRRNKEIGEWKKSYVDTSATYTIPWEALQCYSGDHKPNGYRYRLTKESFGRLTKRIYGVRTFAVTWVGKDVLWETFIRWYISAVDVVQRL